MRKCIAQRELLFSHKGSSARKILIIRIGEPYPLEKGMVNFDFTDGAAGCSMEFDGIEENIHNEAYGVDLLQALQLAVNIEPILEKLSKKYDFYFSSGEPYFE